jgi:hypothetical protein
MCVKFIAGRRGRGRQSSALIITLAAIVLLSAITLVFFQVSSLNRQISFSSAGQYRADLVAHEALDTIVGDLGTEIVAGSTLAADTTGSGTNIYLPANNSTVVPCRVSDQGFANLVKQSASTMPFWSGTSYSGYTAPVRSAAGNSTANSSLNGHTISPAQWNRPGLLGDPGTGATYPAPPSASYTPPDWIVETRKGAISDATVAAAVKVGPGMGTLSDKNPANMNYAVGRYAYAIYDEGGLLDANVVGFPSTISGDFTTKRGLLPQVDLNALADANGQVLTSSSIDAMIQWRNPGTLQAPLSYTNYVFNTTNGFTSVASVGDSVVVNGIPDPVLSPGDQAFVNRQDLISYFLANSGTLRSSALQYLGTFTREINAPSYNPTSLPTADNNPSLINTRVTVAFTKPRSSDGTMPSPGEPLIKYRFPLIRLGWLSYQGATGISPTAPATAFGLAPTSADVLNSFGLQLAPTSTSNSVVWTYDHGAAAGQINTLAQVAAAKREPDFFELLQAAILTGSLGKVGDTTFSVPGTPGINPDSISANQIIQIGCNLIDQYDSDSYPTRIVFNGAEFDGVESLPYLSRIWSTPYRLKNSSNVGIWYQAEVWNPNSSAGIVPTTAPKKFRFVTTGTAFVNIFGVGSPTTPSFTFPNPSSNNTEPSGLGIEFSTAANQFFTPTLLSPAVGATPPLGATQDLVNDGNANFLGELIAYCYVSDTSPADYDHAAAVEGVQGPNQGGPPGMNHSLQYWSGSQWITYSEMRNVCGDVVTSSKYNPSFGTYAPTDYFVRSDPRTDRFGDNGGDAQPINTTLWPVLSNNYLANSTSSVEGTSGWNGVTTGGDYPGSLSENKTTSQTSYSDSDGILRRADGAYNDGTFGDGGYPLASDTFNSTSSRPIILNRPFRSVGDMGYAFRDEPWKHLDFFTAESADAALLDLFCLNESPVPPNPTTAPAAIPIAGKVDLNTRQIPVLQTILSGAIKAEESSTTGPLNTISADEASKLASNLVALTTQAPLINRSELVTRWISDASISSVFSTLPDAVIKRRREAAVRALADVGNTRTWNLLIDVIAQSGKYGPTSTTLDQFTVEGERHYWLHVAIDRYTNQVIAQSLEPVMP